MGVDYLRILGVSQLFMCMEITTAGAFSGLGKTLTPSIVSITLTGARIPMAILLGRWLGLNGVWWAITISSTPGQHDNHGEPIPLPDSICIFRTMVLSHKAVQSRRIAFRSHPGYGFDLRVYLLDCHGSISPACNQSCNDHGNARKQHTLHSGR